MSTDLDPAQIADLRQSWVDAGLSAEQFDAAARSIAPAPSPAAPPAPAPYIPPVVAPPEPGADRATEMARGLLASGTPRAVLEQTLAGDGFSPDAIAKMLGQPQTGSPAEREFIAAGLAGGATPADYGNVIPYEFAGQLADGLPAANAEWTTNLSAMGVPIAAASAVVGAALEVATRVKGMSQEELTSFVDHSDRQLEAIAGSKEAAETMARKATATLAKASPAFRQAVQQNGGLLDSRVIVTLAMAHDHAAHLARLKQGS